MAFDHEAYKRALDSEFYSRPLSDTVIEREAFKKLSKRGDYSGTPLNPQVPAIPELSALLKDCKTFLDPMYKNKKCVKLIERLEAMLRKL